LIGSVKPESRATLGIVISLDFPMVGTDDLLTDRQSKLGALLIGFGLTALCKFIEDRIQFIFGDTDALIFY